jgi:hypothetical protein
MAQAIKQLNNIFELEQQILDCWGITDDIDMLFGAVVEQDIDKDKIANILLGIKELYHLKFERTFNTFEECLRNREFS